MQMSMKSEGLQIRELNRRPKWEQIDQDFRCLYPSILSVPFVFRRITLGQMIIEPTHREYPSLFTKQKIK